MPRFGKAEVKFTAYGIPQPKGSTRSFIVGGKTVTTTANPKLKDWHNAVAWAAQSKRPKDGLFQGAVSVRLEFFFCRPKSVTEKQRPHHTVKPDIDKITRATLDALKGTVYQDDSQVIRLVVEKGYDVTPRVDVEVKAI
jgi:Holliday junction resolvase RusA-like endonuclease